MRDWADRETYDAVIDIMKNHCGAYGIGVGLRLHHVLVQDVSRTLALEEKIAILPDYRGRVCGSVARRNPRLARSPGRNHPSTHPAQLLAASEAYLCSTGAGMAYCRELPMRCEP